MLLHLRSVSFYITLLIVFKPLICFASLETLSLEEKVGQLLMVHFLGETATDEAKYMIQELHVGGIIYYTWANGLTTFEQVKTLSRDLQQFAKETKHHLPLLIAADQEGGVVTRFNEGFTIFPGNMALGMTENPALAQASAYVMGQELLAAGVNMNLAPVVDINNNPRNPIIGVRSYGDTPEKVQSFAKEALLGYRRAHVITSLKHFPGHGDVEADSHKKLPVLNKSREALNSLEFMPFIELAPHADTIMTAHLLVPSLDPDNCATLSPTIINILRKEMGFDGVVITDSLVMEGVLKTCEGIEEVAIQALVAGCDILLVGGKLLVGTDKSNEATTDTIKNIHQAIVDGVRSGRIPQKRLDQAVARILKLKSHYRLKELAESEFTSDLLLSDKLKLAATIAEQAIKVSIRKPLENFCNKKIGIFVPQVLRQPLKQTTARSKNKQVTISFFDEQSPSEAEHLQAMQKASTAEVLIIFSYNAWKSPAQLSYIEKLMQGNKPTILIVTRDPFDAVLFPLADMTIMTYSPVLPSLQSACEKVLQLENRF